MAGGMVFAGFLKYLYQPAA